MDHQIFNFTFNHIHIHSLEVGEKHPGTRPQLACSPTIFWTPATQSAHRFAMESVGHATAGSLMWTQEESIPIQYISIYNYIYILYIIKCNYNYIYIYTCIYIYICICIYIYITYILIHIYIYIYMYKYVYTYIYTHIYTYIYYIYIYTWMLFRTAMYHGIAQCISGSDHPKVRASSSWNISEPLVKPIPLTLC